jgi:hypothetical protein
MEFQLICMGLIAILFGLAVAFFGYRIFLLLLPLWGFVFGFALGAETITTLFGQAFLSTVTGWVVGFIVGLVFAVLSYLFYIIGVALFSASFGYALGVGLMGLIGLEGFLAWLVGIILAVVVAIVVIRFNLQKIAIELITAAGGAAAAILGLLAPFGVVEAGKTFAQTTRGVFQNSVLWLILWIVVAVFAFIFQQRTNQAFELEEPERSF